MLTTDDVQKLREVFATKQDLEEMKENMATKDDFRKVIASVEAVMGEVKVMREEQSLHFQQHDDNNKEHKEIRKRLDRIESVPSIAHEIKK